MIQKKQDGTFEVSFSKRHPKTRVPVTLRRKCTRSGAPIRTQAEAQRVLNELVIEVENRLHLEEVPSWESLVSLYLTSALDRGLTKKTVENARLALVAHTFQRWGKRASDEITTEEIRQLVKAGLEGRSEGQKKNVLKFIRTVFTFGLEAGYLNRNPTPDVKFQTGDKIKKVLTEEQLKIFLSKANMLNHPWYPIWAMACYTGMRNGELYALTWDKVDLDNRLIKVDCSWNNTDGFKSTKSGDDRMVEIAPSLVPLLSELKLRNTDTIYVLPRLTKWDKGEQARELRNFLELLGLPQVRFHDLRASWATVMLNRGIEPAKVMLMGGWKDMKTMMIYMRKAGISIRGITDGLRFHHTERNDAEVVQLSVRS